MLVAHAGAPPPDSLRSCSSCSTVQPNHLVHRVKRAARASKIADHGASCRGHPTADKPGPRAANPRPQRQGMPGAERRLTGRRRLDRGGRSMIESCPSAHGPPLHGSFHVRRIEDPVLPRLPVPPPAGGAPLRGTPETVSPSKRLGHLISVRAQERSARFGGWVPDRGSGVESPRGRVV